MDGQIWHLGKQHAELRLADFAVRLDLSRPADGLWDAGSPDGTCQPTRVLGVQIPSGNGDGPALIERHVRGAVLAVAYEASEDWPVRVDLSWRARAGPESSPALATIDLVVSVCTQVLDVRPELGVQSTLQTLEVLRLADADSDRFEAVSVQPLSPVDASCQPGCLLFRSPRTDLSYAQMVHPADAHRDELTVHADTQHSVRIRHHLFDRRLEKGVILRARVRGTFCRRDQDTRTAVESFRAFRTAGLPLGT